MVPPGSTDRLRENGGTRRFPPVDWRVGDSIYRNRKEFVNAYLEKGREEEKN
jgi:hypothetical protein